MKRLILAILLVGMMQGTALGDEWGYNDTGKWKDVSSNKGPSDHECLMCETSDHCIKVPCQNHQFSKPCISDKSIIAKQLKMIFQIGATAEAICLLKGRPNIKNKTSDELAKEMSECVEAQWQKYLRGD
jgi:hypothetical protein